MTVPLAEELRAWVSAARGAVEWHMETGDGDLAVPDGFRPPPLGRIAPADFTAPTPSPAAAPASDTSTEAPRGQGFAALASAVVAVPTLVQRPAFSPAPTPAAPAAPDSDPSAPAAPVPAPTVEVTGDRPAAAAALAVLRDEIGECTRCPLSQERTELVFGAGDPRARVLFVADQPGPTEDGTGLPFVDESGLLLGRMVRAMGLKRTQVYLTYLVKCHDPDQGPEPGLDPCGGFLDRQIAAVQPEVIIALGDLAARRLTGVDDPLPHLRGRWHDRQGTPVLVTFHPHALLQYPESKRQVWGDLKTAMRKLGLPLPRSRAR